MSPPRREPTDPDALEVGFDGDRQGAVLLIVAAIWYLIVVTILSLIQGRIEAYFARGFARVSGR